MSIDSRHKNDDRPSPADFDTFVPWACGQLGLDAIVIITRTDQIDYTPISSERARASKRAIKIKEDAMDVDSDAAVKSQSDIIMDVKNKKIVRIRTIYDSSDYLVKVKFQKNILVPKALLSIICLIVPFHPRLYHLDIDRGLKQGGLYHVFKIVSLSKITEVILDDTLVPEANYYLLLDKKCAVKYLSLARCKLNDADVHNLTSRLQEAPLSILNLSSNRITDTGAIYLGEVLRSNRNLTYLNLSSNMINDKGADSILNSLSEFPLTTDEVIEKRFKRFTYLRERNKLTLKLAEEMRSGETPVKAPKKKVAKPVTPASSKKYNKEPDLKYSAWSLQNMEVLFGKAQSTAETMLGAFNCPFSSEETVVRDGVVYCLGNNVVCYLNLSYNNLTYFSVKKLYNVLLSQDTIGRVPKGLVNVNMEGNNIPDDCMELMEIEYIIQAGLAATRKISNIFKKKATKASK